MTTGQFTEFIFGHFEEVFLEKLGRIREMGEFLRPLLEYSLG